MKAMRLLTIAGIAALLLASQAAAMPATNRVSVNSSSVEGNDTSWYPSTTHDGNLVAFESIATNLVAFDTNGLTDIFVRDNVTSTTTRVNLGVGSAQANAHSAGADINDDDGRYVVFQSFASNLVSFDSNGVADIFVRDRQFNQTRMISMSSSNGLGNLDSEQASISDDGRFVSFTSQASNLVATDTNGGYDVFLRDRDSDADGIYDESGAVSTTLISVNSGGTDSANHFSWGSRISGDGNYVAFLSHASDIVSGDTNGVADVFVRDVQAGTTVRVSESSAGAESDNDSAAIGISDDGRYVGIWSWATNLVASDTNGAADVFLRDRDTDADGIFDETGAVATTRVSVTNAGGEANGASNEAHMSDDGLFFAFQSHATNLVTGDTNGVGDVFVRNLINGTTARVSEDSSGTQANGESFHPEISGNACTVLFASGATNLVTGDTNGDYDVFRSGGDRDGDDLCDDWETNGIDYDGDGTVDLPIHQSPFNADPNHKDLFVEIDWMDCNVAGCTAGDTHNHQPVAAALTDVTNTFAAAPVTNPDGQTGIDLHAMTDEAVRHITPILFLTNGAGTADDFNDLKQGNPVNPCGTGTSDGHFGTSTDRASANCTNILGARRLAFRYAILGHDWTPSIGSSGVAELPGNDFMVTLGGWSAASIQAVGGQRAAEAATFMHEFGHTVNLRHGGGDNDNCKPNYLSVMSYALTFTNMDPSRPLDYARQTLATLDETNLSEPTSVGGPSNRRIIHGQAGGAFWTWANWAVDWNRDGDTIDTGVSEDVNRIDSIGGCGAATGQMLPGYDDWANVQFGFRGSSDFADGPRTTPSTQIDVTGDEALTAAQSIDVDDDGLSNAADNCPEVVNPDQENAVHPGTSEGDACEDPESDGVVDLDDNCPDVANVGQENADGDAYGDACDNCPTTPTLWFVPPNDSDCDMFTDAQEAFVGTNPAVWCGTDTWPLDFDNNHNINVLDLSFYVGTIGATPPGPPYSVRLDYDGNSAINVLDLSFFVGRIGNSCTP